MVQSSLKLLYTVATRTEHEGVGVELLASQERERALQARITTLSQIATAAEERATTAVEKLAHSEHRIHETEGVAEANSRSQEAEQRAAEAERRAQEAEQRAAEADRRHQTEDQPFWAVDREEIQFTGEILGKGGWADLEVKVAKFRGVRIATNYLHSSPYNCDLFIREMNVAARVRHPNLLLFIGATLQGELTILTELMSTSLRALLEQGELPQQQLVSIACDIAKALNYLHLMRPDPIIHRDVSSANVLLDQGHDNIVGRLKSPTMAQSTSSGRWKQSVLGTPPMLLQRPPTQPSSPTKWTSLASESSWWRCALPNSQLLQSVNA